MSKGLKEWGDDLERYFSDPDQRRDIAEKIDEELKTTQLEEEWKKIDNKFDKVFWTIMLIGVVIAIVSAVAGMMDLTQVDLSKVFSL